MEQGQEFIVVNNTGLFVRWAMSTKNNVPVEKLNKGQEFTVYQTFQGDTYLWGRITEKSSADQRHKYVALSRTGKTFAVPKPGQVVPPTEETEQLTLEERVTRLEKKVGII